MGKGMVFGMGKGGSDASLMSRGRGYLRRHSGMEATCMKRRKARVITVCNKVDDVNLAKQKRAPTMTAPVPATYVVQG